MKKLSIENIKMLAQAERDMDGGKSPFVVSGGGGMLVNPLVMEELGLETGQTVSNVIVIAILEAQRAALHAQIKSEPKT